MSDPGDLTAYRLRPVRSDDAGAVLAAFRSAPDMARQGEVSDLATAQQYVEWLRGERHRAWALVGGDDALVGVVAATVDDLNLSGWIFYWMHAEHRGRGVTTRAVAEVGNHLLEEGLERLELGHRVNNPASGRVALAAGFVPEGLERGKFLIEGERIDVRTYGRLVSDPWPTGGRMEMEGREGGGAARPPSARC